MVANRDLPDFYAITAPLRPGDVRESILDEADCVTWLGRFNRLLTSGIKLVQLRVKDLGREQLRVLVAVCGVSARENGVQLVLNGPPDIAMEFGLAGVHLTSLALNEWSSRSFPEDMLLGVSCHSPQELSRAESVGANFACLSPVRRVAGYRADQLLGFERFGEWVSACSLPVYGLGGLEKADLERVRASGGQGVAGISAFWR